MFLVGVYPTERNWSFPYAGDYIEPCTEYDLEYSYAYQIGDHDQNRARDRFRRAHYFPDYSTSFAILYGDSDLLQLRQQELLAIRAYLLQSDTRPDVLF